MIHLDFAKAFDSVPHDRSLEKMKCHGIRGDVLQCQWVRVFPTGRRQRIVWTNNVITDAELGLEGYVMFRKDRMGKRGGGVLLYIKETIPAYEVQLQEEADCKEALWCNLVTGHTTVTIGVVYRCPNITIQNNEKIHNAISEVSKGDCIIMGDFNHGNIKWDSQQSTGVEDQKLCLVQDNFLTQHVLETTRAARVLDIVLSSQKEFVDNVVAAAIIINCILTQT